MSARDLDPTCLALAPNGQLTLKLAPGTQLVKTAQGLRFTQGEGQSEIVPLFQKAEPVTLPADLTGGESATVTSLHASLSDLIENLRLAGFIEDED